MAKPKRIPAEFNPSIARGAFWPGVVQEAEPVTEPVQEETPVQTIAPVPSPEKSPEPRDFRRIFNELVNEAEKDKKFGRGRIEYYLPAKLVPLFKQVSATGSRMAYDEAAQELLAFVRDQIYGVLPGYEEPATPEQVDGVTVFGKNIDVNMRGKVVVSQIAKLLADRKINPNSFAREAAIRLVGEFGSTDINNIVHGRTRVNDPVSRKLVAHLVVIANDMK